MLSTGSTLEKPGSYSRTADVGQGSGSPAFGSDAGSATGMLPQQAVCPSTVSLSEKRRRAHANSSNDPEVQTRHQDENGWQEPGPTVPSVPWEPAPSWQGPILLTPVSPNLDTLMNPCPGNVFTGAVRPSRQPIRNPTLPLYSELCPILGPPWPSFYLLQAGELQPQDHPPSFWPKTPKSGYSTFIYLFF